MGTLWTAAAWERARQVEEPAQAKPEREAAAVRGAVRASTGYERTDRELGAESPGTVVRSGCCPNVDWLDVDRLQTKLGWKGVSIGEKKRSFVFLLKPQVSPRRAAQS